MLRIYHYYLRVLSESKRWWRMAAWLLLFGILAGFVGGVLGWTVFDLLIDESIDSLEDLAQELQASSIPERIAMLWQNNLLVAAGMLFFGFTLGYIPSLLLIVNGLVIGAVFYLAVAQGQTILFFVTVLPHAWLEIPALILAGGFGVKLGWLWLMPESKGKRKQVLNDTVLECLAIFGLVAVLLLLAAGIEGGVVMELVS